MLRGRLALLLLLIALYARADDWPQRFAQLGDFRLENGEAIRNCRIGYRAAGTLNANRSNAILVPTWFAGRSGDFGTWVGSGKLFDTSKYFVIVVDALGDGVSSSPSNSAEQAGAKFPRFNIRDMVRSQYEMVTRELKLDHLYGVAGLSMGGMQTFQWIVSYPDFMTKAIPITGTPKQTAHDLLLWQTELDLMESFQDSPENLRKAMRTAAAIQALELRTPAWIARTVKPEDAGNHLEIVRKSLQDRDPYDYMSQLRAMIGHDIYRDSPKTIKPRMLVVVALQDEMVNPTPARELARIAGAEVVMLSGDCGHIAPACESEVLMREVWRFLE